MYIRENELWMFDDIKSLRKLETEQIFDMVGLISAEIDEYCNTRFEPTEDCCSLDFCEKFHTRRQPLLRVRGLSLHGRRLKEDRDFYVYPESARVEVERQESRGYKKALKVSYLYGYTEVPATVKQVIVELLKLDMEAKGLPSQVLQSENWDGEYVYTMQGSKDLTPAELRKNILARLDIFRVDPYVEPRNNRVVRARLL